LRLWGLWCGCGEDVDGAGEDAECAREAMSGFYYIIDLLPVCRSRAEYFFIIGVFYRSCAASRLLFLW
jgi:hypothetical protein